MKDRASRSIRRPCLAQVLRGSVVVCATLALGPLAVACGDSLESGTYPTSGNNSGNNGATNNGCCANNGSANNGTNNSTNNGFIPEPEERLDFRRPQASAEYVFVANPELDSVAKINGLTLEITSIEVGDRPTVVRASPDTDTAVALNEGSADVSIIHASAEVDDVITLPVRAGFNNIAMAPGGAWAVAYLDYAEVQVGDDIGTFQDVNVIKLEEGREAVFNVAVGFHVIEVEFDDDGERAFVVTEDGVSVLHAATIVEDTNAQPRAVSLDPLEDAQSIDREVEVTANGELALVRSSVLEGINIVALSGRSRIETLTLPGVPTDLDLYPDSTRAVAVIKGTRQLALIDLALAVDSPETAVELIDIPDGPIGLATLDPGNDRALLYSVSEGTPALTRVDFATSKQTVWQIRKAIQGVEISPSGGRAVIFHPANTTPTSMSEADRVVAASYAYTIIELQSGFSRLQTTPARPGEYAFTNDSRWMFIAMDDPSDRVRQVDRIDLQTFRVDNLTLTSPPQHIGRLPEGAAFDIYVSQKHAAGRMTFFATDDSEAKTVTGFELNSQIE